MPTPLPHYPFELVLNGAARKAAPYPDALTQRFGRPDFENARDVISQWPGYEVTPLHRLDGLADVLGVDRIFYKDESQRFGLRSFKPLGGAYAVTRLMTRLIEQRYGDRVEPADLLAGRYAERIADITVTAATDGNHGRSVAWGAQKCGCRCTVYIHQHVSVQREHAIASLGAEVIRLPGHYDDSVRKAYESARAPDWYIIQDTTNGEAIETTLDVMHGYTLLAGEVIEQLPRDQLPTHVFLQAGVGGMAAAVLARFWYELDEQRPVTVLVEPRAAACCFLSLKAGQPEVAPGNLQTIMAGLACGEVSSLAWEILEPGAEAAMTVDDDSVADCMRLLAEGRCGDVPIVAGESAVAGLVGLIAVMQAPDAARSLGLTRKSRVLVYGTEGDTDPELYQRIVGASANEVRNEA
jgi:diaminopropionate ammonia-lyase